MSVAFEGLSSVDRRATTLLRREHEAILGAFRKFHATPASSGTQRARFAREIALLLELQDCLDRNVVYVALEPYYSALVRAFIAEHDELIEEVGEIRRCGHDPDRAADAVGRLEALARHHLGQEQTSLFAAVEHDEPGLNSSLYAAIVDERERLIRQMCAAR